jgi:hypothetical protein
MLNENKLKNIVFAMYNYHEDHAQFPPQAIYDAAGNPLLSWRVALLPYLGREELYKQFHLDEPWDSAHNLTLLSQMPHIYKHRWATPPEPYMTYFRVFVTAPDVRPRSIFVGRLGIHRGVISARDGLESTIMIVEAAEAVPWTKPAELPFVPGQPLAKLGGHFRKGFSIIMCDFSFYFVRPKFDEQQMKAAITYDGGETIDIDKLCGRAP